MMATTSMTSRCIRLSSQLTLHVSFNHLRPLTSTIRSGPATSVPDFLAPRSLYSLSRSRFNHFNSTPHHIQRRSKTTNLASSTPSPPAPARVLSNPRVDEDGRPMTITITPRASNRLQEIMTTDNNPSLALRVTVSSGGCHGFQYLMSLENVSLDSNSTQSMCSPSIKAKDTDADLDADESDGEAGDTLFEDPFGNNARVVMNEPSLRLLRGSRVDYTEELIGSQFKIVGNPRASSSCGCGTSFDVEF